MELKIAKILLELTKEIEGAKNSNDLDNLYLKIFGKNSALNSLTEKISTLSASERPKAGKSINLAKQQLEKLFEVKKTALKTLDKKTKPIDVTVPGKRTEIGHKHLVSQAIDEIYEIFARLGFSLQSYPEVDFDWYAFESLNMPKGHPARDDWETFFIKAPQDQKYGSQVLTPHTSSGQVREMERVKKPPIRMINISRCYRRQIDVSHTPMFHQFEGLLIDKNVSIADLKGTFDFFTTQFFGSSRVTRLRPHHFRFTEPSFEVDVTCDICNGQGCRLCKEGWLELGGAGMVHPNVIKAGKIDPEIYTGFAFGWGIERTIHGQEFLRLHLFLSNREDKKRVLECS